MYEVAFRITHALARIGRFFRLRRRSKMVKRIDAYKFDKVDISGWPTTRSPLIVRLLRGRP